MPRFNLYIEVSTGLSVAAVDDLTDAPLPIFTQEDTLSLRVYLVRYTGPETDPERILTTGNDIQMAIGRKIGNTSTLYTQQYSWTPNTDLADPYWEADLPMDTEAIATLLGSSEKKIAWLEVKFFESGEPSTVLSQSVTINAAVIKDGATTVPVGSTALSTTVAAATYQPLTELRLPTYAKDYVTNKTVYLHIDSSGVLHADPVA
jgi:hypothetical protein